jgi:hypothetical protein
MPFGTTALAAMLALGAIVSTSASAVDLIAIGKLPGTASDYSGQSQMLENGVRADLLGGMGSGLAWAGGHYYFSGRSDNFRSSTPSSDAQDARFDPEGIRVSRDGESVYISDEYGPYLCEFDRRSSNACARSSCRPSWPSP